MKKLRLVCALSVALFVPYALYANTPDAPLIQPQTADFSVLPQQVNKSPADKANYQAIQLKNDLTVLLISDPNANKSLIALGVGVGSMEDPDNQLGLAHYLEHMVFMGSKNYPEINGLDQYIKKNGGYSNASTSFNRTAYYLQVNNNAFNGAVERFADMLAAPLLRAENGAKEVNAVNAEMVRAKASDGWRAYSVEQATYNPNNPKAKFSMGSNVTLSDKPDSQLNAALKQFYQTHYSANLMKAVIYSNQSLEQLAQLAAKTLGKIENKQLPENTINEPLYRPEDRGKLVHYKPIKPSKSIELNFDFPDDKGAFKHKSNEYLAYVLSNNSAGTLSDYLVKNGYSDSGILANGSTKLGRNWAGFSIYLALTDKGWAQRDRIISMIFQNIEKIKQAGITANYFNELKTSLSQTFEHLQIEKSGSYVQGLVDQMFLYPLEHIIDADFIASTIDKTEIEHNLAQMTPDNLVLVETSPEVKTNATTDHLGAPYAIANISEAQKKSWLDFSQNPSFDLPKLNPYFADDFRLNTPNSQQTTPTLVEQGQGEAVYAMPSRYFAKEPKAMSKYVLTLSNKQSDVKTYAATSALNYIHDLAQAEISSQANVAGMAFNLGFGLNGVMFDLAGYTQHYQKLAQDALAKARAFEINEAGLAQAKERMLEALDRQEKDDSQKVALRPYNDLMGNNGEFIFSAEHKRAAINQLTLADLHAQRARLLDQADGLKALTIGNLNDEQVRQLSATVTTFIKNADTTLPRSTVVDFSHLSDKISLVKMIPHEDSALHLTYLVPGEEDMKDFVRANFVRNIIGRWYFDDLRTDKQLGYVAWAGAAHSSGKTHGLQFLVQSPTSTPAQIMVHNQRFFNETWEKLQKLTNEEFEQYRSSYLNTLLQKPESLASEFQQQLGDFERNNAKFDALEQQIATLKNLTKEDVLAFYKAAVIDQTGFVLASQAVGTRAGASGVAKFDGYKTINELESYFNRLPKMQW